MPLAPYGYFSNNLEKNDTNTEFNNNYYLNQNDNHLIIPLLRVIRCLVSFHFVPTRSGGMDDLWMK